MSLSQIVDVQITRQTQSVSQAGFGTMLIAGINATFPERLRFYTDAEGVGEDFDEADAEYLAAQKAFGQTPRPTQIAIGRLNAIVAGVSTITFNQAFGVGDEASVDVNGITCTASTIAALASAIDAVDGIASATVLGNVITVTSDAGRTLTLANLDITSTLGLTGALAVVTAAVTVASGLDAIEIENSEWYALVLTSKTLADQLTAAAWIEARHKIFFARSDAAGVKDGTSTSDIAYRLQAGAYDRTAVIFTGTPNDFVDAAWLGKMLPEAPGSATYKFKTLAGVTVDKLTPTESAAIKAKNANTYETIGGVNITAEGVMASGEFIDIIIGTDWLQARIQERVYAKLVQLKKIPFTDAGVAVIENEVRAQLTEAIGVGLLSQDPEPTVSVPKVADVSPADKANRYLPDVKFAATLAGAVHKTQIRGTVSV
jgi:hypothetical protein